MFWKRKLLGATGTSTVDYLTFGYNWQNNEEAPVVSYDLRSGTVSGIVPKFGNDAYFLSGNPISIGSPHCFDSAFAYASGTIDRVDFSSLVRADAGDDFASAFLETNVKYFAFNSLTTIGRNSLNQFNKKFDNTNNITTHLYMPMLQTIGERGMYQAFYYDEFDSGFSLSHLKTVGDYGLYQAFYYMKANGMAMSLPALETVGRSGMYGCFFGASTTDIDISFTNLTSIASYGFFQAFYGCKNLQRVSFPALTTSGVEITGTSAGSNPLYYAFNQCTNITELHFPASFSSYSNYLTKAVLFGGTSSTYCNPNLQILFDL